MVGSAVAQEEKGAFVAYPEKIESYFERVQKGRQTHAFDGSGNFKEWQKKARAALIQLVGLKQMGEELAGFEGKVTMGEPVDVGGKFSRTLCSLETEPGVTVPFYFLVPISASREKPAPLIVCPHGHDVRGLHSYAGAFKDAKHREEILAREGNIAEQAALRGMVAIAPATRGLSSETLVPDPKGRHGKRPCRAQLIHCLIAGRTPNGERVWDMQRIIDWAEKQEMVDPKRIAMTGNSGGGVLTAYVAAIDPRIRVAIPSCSFTSATSSEGFVFHCDCCLVPGLRNWGDWAELGGLIAPRELLIVHGPQDRLHKKADVVKNAAAVAKIFDAAGVPDRVSLKWGHGGHRFYPELIWPVLEKGLNSR